MSGRISYHVNEANGNTCSPGFGVPLNMTMISERLVQDAGYVAHQIGKWLKIIYIYSLCTYMLLLIAINCLCL